MKFRIRKNDLEALVRRVPEFEALVRREPPKSFECVRDLFEALVRSIVAQQLSVKAADSITRRLEGLLGGFDAEKLLAAETGDLRACGLSAQKIGYLRGIAEAKCSGRVNFRSLARRPDAEIVAELVKLKGVGVWTAEMLLIFALGRPDVMSFRDLGIRRGAMLLLGRTEELSEEEFEDFRRRCSPCGTLASLCLWRIKDGGLSVSKTP